MTIGCDLDEVLSPLLSHHCEFLNKKYNLKLTEEDFTHYQYWGQAYGVSMEQCIDDFLEFSETEDFHKIKPYEEAIFGLNELRKIDKLSIITARQDNLYNSTMIHLKRNFPPVFSQVLFGNSHSKHGQKKTKRELCEKAGIWLFIEDDPHHAENVAIDIPVILFDKPWNKNCFDKNIIRAYNWNQIVDIAREIALFPYLR